MPLPYHHRLSVSALSSWNWTLQQDLAWWAEAGVRRVGIWTDKLDGAGWDAGVAAVAGAGLEVGNVIGAGPFRLDHPELWDEQRLRFAAMLDATATLGTDLLALTTGAAPGMDWDQAVSALSGATGPVLAGRPTTRVAFEHTHALRPELGFVHRLVDAVDLAAELGVGVLMEVNACWAERDLYKTIAAKASSIFLVQVDDFVIGTRDTPNRVVPGDGDIPLERILGALLDAGYAGDFDLEIVGPVIEEEGYPSAISRSVERLVTMLERLGA